jgi:hypothetical protein
VRVAVREQAAELERHWEGAGAGSGEEDHRGLGCGVNRKNRVFPHTCFTNAWWPEVSVTHLTKFSWWSTNLKPCTVILN